MLSLSEIDLGAEIPNVSGCDAFDLDDLGFFFLVNLFQGA